MLFMKLSEFEHFYYMLILSREGNTDKRMCYISMCLLTTQ